MALRRHFQTSYVPKTSHNRCVLHDPALGLQNWTGVNFTTGGAPRGYIDTHNMTQPVVSAGLAWLHYTARAAGQAGALDCSDAACQAQQLEAAQWGLDYLEDIEYDPFWEVGRQS